MFKHQETFKCEIKFIKHPSIYKEKKKQKPQWKRNKVNSLPMLKKLKIGLELDKLMD